ncbi:hypothetical protein B0H16DRAFT_1569506, partial [Mycena metata]
TTKRKRETQYDLPRADLDISFLLCLISIPLHSFNFSSLYLLAIPPPYSPSFHVSRIPLFSPPAFIPIVRPFVFTPALPPGFDPSFYLAIRLRYLSRCYTHEGWVNHGLALKLNYALLGSFAQAGPAKARLTRRRWGISATRTRRMVLAA